MTYIPTRVITVSGISITESDDLTSPLTAYVNKNTFLVVTKNQTNYVIDINKIILFEAGIILSHALNTAFASLLTDLFVARYSRFDIPLLNNHKTYHKRLRVYSALTRKGYSVGFTSIDSPQYVDDITRRGFLDDLVISSSEDLSHCLVAVNGVFHKTVMHQNKLYVMDGFRTCRLSDARDVTIVNTKTIGGHSVVPLTTNNTMLSVYNGIATVNAETSLKDKTVFLVVDGYFYHLDSDVYYHADDTHLKIKMNKLPLISQFRHNPRTMTRPDRYGEDASQSSRKYVDEYHTVFLNNRNVPTATLTTRDFQYSRLTHYHSFLVVVDNPSVFSISNILLPSGTLQYYQDMSGKVISGMLSYGEGLCPSYVIQEDPFNRKSIFIQKQDYDTDRQNQTISPLYIPSLMEDPLDGSDVFCRLVDYVSA